MRRVIVHVDRLVLKGVEQKDRHRVAADLEGELSRLLADPTAFGGLTSLTHTPGIDIGMESAAHGGKQQRPGMSAGKAIARGLSR